MFTEKSLKTSYASSPKGSREDLLKHSVSEGTF